MAPISIIDSHIHLWPESMSNEQGHAWMTPGMPLAKQHILSDYYQASQQANTKVEGVIYVESDVRYEPPSGDLSTWAKGPLDEIKFLRSIVEGEYGERDSEMLKGIVAWAPLDQPPSVLKEWLDIAEKTAGPKTWARVKGFRFLLQFILDQTKFEALVSSQDFIQNLRILGERGFSFDVGVDQRCGGSWQLEAVVKAMKAAHEGVDGEKKVTFVINHLCKPDFEANEESFNRWKNAVGDMAGLDKTYMKLSGAFSELPEGLTTTDSIAAKMKPWIQHVLKAFGPKRVMFGSDWPVCNLRGPKGEESWVAWTDVIKTVLDDEEYGLTQEEKDRIWKGTAREAYLMN
ncbi:hypothetical protein PRZ48_004543 [Zasmidium cellare]|uniref:Amidohydrolase-related domain-containing protein n=1 Tax=Zasmidium cellare TaxID=395010 RepID=A0ABR0ER02_ZASCE|nr:hypothetical protein PRZ48_004543 [Zasmidium cellare]